MSSSVNPQMSQMDVDERYVWDRTRESRLSARPEGSMFLGLPRLVMKQRRWR